MNTIYSDLFPPSGCCQESIMMMTAMETMMATLLAFL